MTSRVLPAWGFLAVCLASAGAHSQYYQYVPVAQPLVQVNPMMITPIAGGWGQNVMTATVTPYGMATPVYVGLGYVQPPPVPARSDSRLEEQARINPQLGAYPVVQPPTTRYISALGTYTVQKGAHLVSVAKRTNTSYDDLILLNPDICVNDLMPAGRVVKLPIPGNY